MLYVFQVSDPGGAHVVDFHLTPALVEQKAIDVVFDVLGADPQDLSRKNLINPQQTDDVAAIQQCLFDEDDQGKFIRDDVRITAFGKDLDPDRPLLESFWKVPQGILPAKIETASAGAIDKPLDRRVEEYARLVFLHQIAEGKSLDVTVEHPELQPLIDWAEKEQLIEIDVKRAAYKLSPRGKDEQYQQLVEAQDLVKRFDIFGDVDMDSSGKAHFDTGLGRDLRVAVYESEGVDPFRARLLIGLNDGEWANSDWPSVIMRADWYDRIFEPIEKAPSPQEIGESALRSVIEQGKKTLRDELI
jgi:hypothetical protein